MKNLPLGGSTTCRQESLKPHVQAGVIGTPRAGGSRWNNLSEGNNNSSVDLAGRTASGLLDRCLEREEMSSVCAE